MGGILGGIQKFGHKFDPIDRWVAGKLGGNLYSTNRPPQTPDAPTIDSAANASQESSDLMRRRRGVLANIYAGNNPQSPQVQTKSLLGGGG